MSCEPSVSIQWQTSQYRLGCSGIAVPVQQTDKTTFFHFPSVFYHLSLLLFIHPFYLSLLFVHDFSPCLCFLSFFPFYYPKISLFNLCRYTCLFMYFYLSFFHSPFVLVTSLWSSRKSNFLSNAPRSRAKHCFLEGSQSSPFCPSAKSNM